MAWATESGHWYTPDGEPAYTIIGKNGKERATNVKDAREKGLLPSVTSIIRSASAPALERWKADQLLMAALTLPRNPDESEKSWISRVWQDSAEQGKKAAEHGTRIHGAIENYYRGGSTDAEMWPYVNAASDRIAEEFGAQAWRPEKSFADVALGYGGKVDLHAENILIDFKGKDGDLVDVTCYDEHYMQIAAYCRGLHMKFAQCGILFVSRTHPGSVRLVLHTPEEKIRGWNMFLGLLNYWKAAHKMKEAA